MTEKPKDRGAVLQMEIDVKRWQATEGTSFNAAGYGEKPWDRLYAIAKTAVCDTLYNGGTLVVVRDKERGTVTIVQRPDVEAIEP